MKWSEIIFIQALKLQMSDFIMSWNIVKQILFFYKVGAFTYYFLT